MDHADNTNAVFAQALTGIKFPATRDQLIEQAKTNGADTHVMSVLKGMPNDDTYNTMPDVFKNTHIGVESTNKGASKTTASSTSSKR